MILKYDPKKKKKAGFSLLELAIVLGVIGTVLAALWGVVSIVNENMKRSQMKEQMLVMVDSIRDHFAIKACASINNNCPNNAELTNYLLQKGVLPEDVLRNRSVAAAQWRADHPWGGDATDGGVRVYPGDYNNNSSDRFFTIELNSLDNDNCMALVSKFTGLGAPSGLNLLRVNATKNYKAEDGDFPVHPEDSTTECTGGNGGNDLLFVYDLRK